MNFLWNSWLHHFVFGQDNFGNETKGHVDYQIFFLSCTITDLSLGIIDYKILSPKEGIVFSHQISMIIKYNDLEILSPKEGIIF